MTTQNIRGLENMAYKPQWKKLGLFALLKGQLRGEREIAFGRTGGCNKEERNKPYSHPL